MIDLPKVLEQHFADFISCQTQVNSGLSRGHSIDALFLLHQPHIALDSQEAELNYLRGFVDKLLKIILQRNEFKNVACRSILREILGTLLLNLANNLSTPQTLYNIVFNSITRKESEVRKEFIKLRRLGSSREFEILRGRENIRGVKTTASILHTLLQSTEDDDNDIKNASADPVYGRNESESKKHSRSSSHFVPSTDRTLIEDSEHPLTNEVRRSSHTLSRSLYQPKQHNRPDDNIEVSNSNLGSDDIENELSLTPTIDSVVNSPSSTFPRLRSNATHITKQISKASSRSSHKKNSSIGSTSSKKSIVSNSRKRSSIDEANVPNEKSRITLLSKAGEMYENFLLFLSYIYIYAQKLTTLLMNRKPRVREERLDQHWFSVLSYLLFFVTPFSSSRDPGNIIKTSSMLYMFVDVLLRPLAWLSFGGLLEKSIEDGALILVEPEMVSIYLRQLSNLLWPAPSHLLLDHPPPIYVSVDDLRKLLHEKIPGSAKFLLQANRVDASVDLLIDMLAHQAINKRLFYSLLDVIIDNLLVANSK
jgi:hypothetical protein